MTGGQLIAWCVIAVVGLIPFNWARLWLIGDVSPTSTAMEFATGTLVCWALAAGGAYLMLRLMRMKRERAQRAARVLQQLRDAPLTEITPARARLKAGEKAYISINAGLQEVKTVGFEAGTTGVSFRVAKGLSIRSSGTRGHAVKNAVITAHGELVATSERVIFAGDLKSFSIPFGKLLNITRYKDGFGFNEDKRSYTVVADDPNESLIFGVVLDKVLAREVPPKEPAHSHSRAAGVASEADTDELDIVGESHYQDALANLFGPKGTNGINVDCDALLIAEPENRHDKNAIRCEIRGKQVGYLSREDAERFAAYMSGRGVKSLSVPAHVRGGWKNRRNEGSYGVAVDVPGNWLE